MNPARNTKLQTLLTLLFLSLPSLAFAIEPAKENVPGGTLMLAAYMLIWALPLTFLWFSHKRITALEGDLDELRSLLSRVKEATQDLPAQEDAAE